MKRTLMILLCLMLTGCMRAMPPNNAGGANQSLTAAPETGIRTDSAVSDTEPTATEMTEETAPTVRISTAAETDAPAQTEQTETHRTTSTQTTAEAVRETQESVGTVPAATTAASNPPPVSTSRTTATVQTAPQTVQIGTTAAITTSAETAPSVETRYDWSRIPMQIQVFMEEYEIDADTLFAIGTELSGTEYERACAAAQTAQKMGGRNCIEYALHAYFIADGAGLTVGIARSTLYDWYGHVANAVMLGGEWYYMEPQGGLAGLAQTYANGYYPDGLDAVTDIYGNPLDVRYAGHPYN